jgi:type IV pilus assembly protein PilE
MNSFNVKREAGMTLIELLVVMMIVAILAAISIPTYQSQVMKSHRAAARACLNEYAQYMERFYTSNMTYEMDDLPVLACATDGDLDVRYGFDFNPDPTQRTYRIRAVPRGAQLDRDTDCGTLTLNQAGLRTESGTKTVDECWEWSRVGKVGRKTSPHFPHPAPSSSVDSRCGTSSSPPRGRPAGTPASC